MVDSQQNKLPQLLQQLPQELFDMIHDLVFTTQLHSRVLLTDKHQPPTTLCVSKATRNLSADSYCRNSMFIINDYDTALIWISSLDPSQLERLTHIEIGGNCSNTLRIKGILDRKQTIEVEMSRVKVFVHAMNYAGFKVPSWPNQPQSSVPPMPWATGPSDMLEFVPLESQKSEPQDRKLWRFEHAWGCTVFTRVAQPASSPC